MAPLRHTTPRISVIIGRVSTIDSAQVFNTLDALRDQECGFDFEVVLADRLDNGDSVAIRDRYPEFRVIRCPAETSLPELRAIALDAAKGSVVAVTEDHCVPPPDWIHNLAQAFEDAPEGTLAVGGCISNGVAETAFDRATFLCEYAAFQYPVPEGPCDTLPGMNIAYLRSSLLGFNAKTLQSGFWEATVHPDLRGAGAGFFSTNRIKTLHCKKFSLASFFRQRFLYSRHYAGSRVASQALPQRLAMFFLSFVLPPILVGRLVRTLWRKRASGTETLGALPFLLLFLMVGVCGELTGCLIGPGDALARIE